MSSASVATYGGANMLKWSPGTYTHCSDSPSPTRSQPFSGSSWWSCGARSPIRTGGRPLVVLINVTGTSTGRGQ
jgi:hypothetical protein